MPSRDETLLQQLLSVEHEVLKIVATDMDLAAAMDLLCRRVEEIVPEAVCSIIAISDSGLLHPVAAPSLPHSYSAALDGAPIGPKVGSCGTAAYRKAPVEVRDIETDPLWHDFKGLALPLGLLACWSSPIFAKDGQVIGTFAFYYPTKRGADPVEVTIVDYCVHVCAIAMEHDRARQQIHRIAFSDTVTGLPNRVAFQNEAEQLIGDIAGTERAISIHYVDLDDFKGVNDTLGHQVGDHLLRIIGERLSEVAGSEATVARLGGDEFAILQADAGVVEAERLVRRVLLSFERPFMVDGHVITLAASCGIARAPQDGGTVNELMKNADLALYRAKANGRGRYQFFVPSMAEAAHNRRELENDLRGAIERNELYLVYQPIVDLATGRHSSCEALLRWKHPTRGEIPPMDFVPVAEQIGLISQIGGWVLQEACSQAAGWPDSISVAINLSAVQLRNAGFMQEVSRALAKSGLPASRLILEITESVILKETRQTKSVLAKLRRIGVRIALDDFGTGYSSLRSLRAFPIDKIKIDKSFVHEIGRTPHSMTIIMALIRLARDLGMDTTAEGIETAGQLEWLNRSGCTEGQGFYFARPKPAADLAALLAREPDAAGPESSDRPKAATA